MILNTCPDPVRATLPAETVADEAARSYDLYGMLVRGDIPLPLAPLANPPVTPPAWTFHGVEPGQPAPAPDGPEVAQLRCQHHGNIIAVRHQGPGGSWIRNPWIATFHLAPDGRWVDVYPEPLADEQTIALTLLGEVSIFVLQTLGYPSLHASAVVTPRGAVVFIGVPGQGKSTMAATFLQRGATLLADDNLPLRLLDGRVHGGPSVPIMKVWRETVECSLEISGELPSVATSVDKKLLTVSEQYKFSSEPVRLDAIYLLNRYDPTATGRTDVTFSALSGREAIATLLAHTAYGTLARPAETARFLPLYARLVAQAPVRVLAYPNGFGHQDRVHARILEDVGAR
ncbi:MAG: hypothetical protein ACRDIY_02665 [Chloroflexota bacterium]